jgi:hypothetical protein
MGETREAGCELDALVAEKVMGWLGVVPEYMDVDRTRWFVPSGVPSYDVPREKVPAYSTDIAAAWTVVVELSRVGRSIGVFAESSGDYVCEIKDLDRTTDKYEYVAWTESETAPHAICLAALDVSGSSLLVEGTPNE